MFGKDGKLFPVIFGASFFALVALAYLFFSPSTISAKTKIIDENKKIKFEKFFDEKELDFLSEKKKLSSYKEPIVLLNFWATWCTPCVREFDSMKKLQEKFGADKFKIVGVNCDGDKSARQIKRFKKRHKLNFQSVLDPETSILDQFSLSNIPATVIYHKGKVIYFSNKETKFLDKEIISIIKSNLSDV